MSIYTSIAANCLRWRELWRGSGRFATLALSMLLSAPFNVCASDASDELHPSAAAVTSAETTDITTANWRFPPMVALRGGNLAAADPPSMDVLGLGNGPAGDPYPRCDVQWLAYSDLSQAQQCELRALTKRCSLSDGCRIRCERHGGLPETGGGCAHVCVAGRRVTEARGRFGEELDDSDAPTTESAACLDRAD